MVNVASLDHLENISDGFKEVLNTLLLVEVGNYNKIDESILMFGMRSFSALKRRQDKITEGRKAVLACMRHSQIYLRFADIHKKQLEVQMVDRQNVADGGYYNIGEHWMLSPKTLMTFRTYPYLDKKLDWR